MTDTIGQGAETAKSDAQGTSPYATGGGGVTLERRAAVLYLARLLTGATGPELHGRRVQRVTFQQAPPRTVDDIGVLAMRDDGTDPLELDIAVRRAPAFTTSDSDTQSLFGDLLAALPTSQPEAAERRLAICVAGPRAAAQQVSELAALARQQATADGFLSLVRTPHRFTRAIRERLGHLVNLVAANLSGGNTSDQAAEVATWQLLRHLEILMPRLEPPDETDWSELLNQLQPWARDETIAAARALRDGLAARADSYAPAAADIDLATLRRDVHELLHVERRRRAAGWKELRRLDADARRAVRSTLGVDPAAGPLHLARPGLASLVRKELNSSGGVLISGESGVGKSAMVLGELAAAAASDPARNEVVFLNLRLLPRTMIEVRSALGAPLEELLAEMSAPTRILVVDAAEVMIERDDHLLAQLLDAARTAGVSSWVVSATDGRGAVEAVMQQHAGAVRNLFVGGLEDGELEEVVRAFPQLRRLVDEPRAKELLRRPAIIDLFVRSGSQGLPLSEADAFEIVWTKLVRNNERANRGLPEARDQVMRQLAAQQLQTDRVALSASVDAAAVAGLQHDALLRLADRWQPLPVFSHELLRTYSVAAVLLASDDPMRELIANGAPRWALPALRLAVQVLLRAPDAPETPIAGRFARLQSATERLPAEGHGDRWADLPTEALLDLPKARAILADAWPTLVAGEAAGLRRVLRVIQQRHGRTGFIDTLAAEPLVALLLEEGWHSRLQDDVDKLLRGWLRGLVIAGEPAGHPLRIALRERLVASVKAGDERLARFRRKETARLAARSAEEVAQDEARMRAARSVMSLGSRRHRRRSRELPIELSDDELLEQLALLGSDIGESGEALLRRVADGAPHRLSAAVEGLLTGNGLASHDIRLLVHLVEAYYIDEREDEVYDGLGDDGIRDHRPVGLSMPSAAAYRGPFLAMLRANLPMGVACLNRLLDHAAQARVQILRRLSRREAPEPEAWYIVELDITGERRRYYGDEHVWLWYRGTGVGPYPCQSALQALELVCDEALTAGIPVNSLVRLLLHDCKNLAMPALVVGMLVRHLERIGSELDPFFAEPSIWHLEFVRHVHEQSGLAARTQGTARPERRTWDLGDAALRLTMSAKGERSNVLKAIGRKLIARAAELQGAGADDEPLSEELAVVRRWASNLDRDSHKFIKIDQGVLVQPTVDEEVGARLASSSADLVRGQEVVRLMFRYPERYDHIVDRTPITLDELLSDLGTAFDLANDPPAEGPGGPYGVPAAVAAAALEARFLDAARVPEDDLVWAAGLLIRLVNSLADQDASEVYDSVYGGGVSRSAARALPLLWLPPARSLRERLAAEGVDADAITRGIGWIVESGADEARLFLARAFDPLWETPCGASVGDCHHFAALSVIEDTARDSLIGAWDPEQQRTRRIHIDGPVEPHLHDAKNDRVYVARLSATIRGAAAAAVSSACCREDAVLLLTAALAAHRRGRRKHDHGYLHSGSDAAAAARAVLDIASTGDDSLLFTQLDDYSDNPRLLSEFLDALVAAGEETPRRAATVRDLWPAVLERVVELVASGACSVDDRQYRQTPLTAVIPTPSNPSGYLHREYEGEPILWGDPVALAPQIEQWLPLAAGHPRCVDALTQLLHQMPPAQQAALGLQWIEQLVIRDPERIANRSYLLPEWLELVRPHSSSQSLLAEWHRIVDALTVAGDARIAALAD